MNKRPESTFNKWLTSVAGSPVFFIRNAKMDYRNCVDFCNHLKPKSEVAMVKKNDELWLEKNNLIETSENYWIYQTGQLADQCHYIAGTGQPQETQCHGYRHSCRDHTFKSRVTKASACTFKYRCICQQRVKRNQY